VYSLHQKPKPATPTGAPACSGSPELKAASAQDAGHGDGAFDVAERKYKLYARKAYAAGEQVFMNYGGHSNLQLLGAPSAGSLQFAVIPVHGTCCRYKQH
jgi:hypothetical protein